MASKIKWDIRLEGRAWEKDEAWERYQLTPEKFEMIQGKLFWSDEDRLNMLGMMLENLGVRKAVRLGDPQIWREAIAELENRDTE